MRISFFTCPTTKRHPSGCLFAYVVVGAHAHLGFDRGTCPSENMVEMCARHILDKKQPASRENGLFFVKAYGCRGGVFFVVMYSV